MNPQQLQAAAQQWISSFDSTANRAIGAWRQGGDRLGEMTRARWETAFAQSSPQLSAETRQNATRAQEAFAGCYAKGVALSADGARAAVETLVQTAQAVVERAGSWRAGRA